MNGEVRRFAEEDRGAFEGEVLVDADLPNPARVLESIGEVPAIWAPRAEKSPEGLGGGRTGEGGRLVVR